MAKTNQERQQTYIKKHKNDGAYLEKRKVIRHRHNEKKKATETATEKLMRQKDARLRKQKSRIRLAEKARLSTAMKTPPKMAPSSVGKAMKKLARALPQSPRKQTYIINKFVNTQELVLKPTTPIFRNRIEPETVETVVKFYEKDEISRVDPGFKTARVSRTGQRLIKPRRNMLFTINEAHSLFCEEHSTIKIGRSKFASLRPSHVKPYRDIPHNVCICRYHENFAMLHEAITKETTTLGSTVQEFVSFVCDKTNVDCMSSTCETCGDKIKQKFDEELEDPDKNITYRQWRNIDGRYENVIQENTLFDAIQDLESQCSPYLLHCFNMSQSQFHFNAMRKSASKSNVILQVDFAENYACCYQNEIQSAHWGNPQVALFTAVLWYGPEDMSSYAVASDNITHDRYCVDRFLRLILASFLEENPEMTSVHIFSDGAASQFKQKYNFANVTLIKDEMGLKDLTWTFFATSHGKGAVDGIGAVVKRRVWNDVRANKVVVRNAASFVNVFNDNTVKTKVLLVPEEDIVNVKDTLDKAWAGIETLKGTQKLHHISAKSPYQIIWKSHPQQVEGTLFCMKSMEMDSDSENDVEIDCEEDVDLNSDDLEDPAAVRPVCGQWVAVNYDGCWLPGTIELIQGTEGSIKFMKRVGGNCFMWSEKDDIGSVDYSTILGVMNHHPELASYTGRAIHKLPVDEYDRLDNLLKSML